MLARGTHRLLTALLVLSALSGSAAAKKRVRLRIDAELENYLPTHSGRQIHSLFANAVVGAELWRGLLVLEAGLTATSAWGYITQPDSNGRDVRYDTAVAGAGPLFMIRCEPIHVDAFSVSLDVVGGLVLYSARFPPGGDIYNFTWRLGGVFAARLTDRLTITGGVRWMHVSNGQGLTPKNPSYEGFGFPVGLVYRF